MYGYSLHHLSMVCDGEVQGTAQRPQSINTLVYMYTCVYMCILEEMGSPTFCLKVIGSEEGRSNARAKCGARAHGHRSISSPSIRYMSIGTLLPTEEPQPTANQLHLM